MIYKNLQQLLKTLFVTLALLGVYGNSHALAQFVQLAQTLPQVPDNGAPKERQAGATHAQNPPPPPDQGAPAPANRPGGGSRNPQNAPSPPPTPPDNGAPGQREGAGSRGRCPRVDKRLTALVPIVKKTASVTQATRDFRTSLEFVAGSTFAERPTFWFFNPYSLSAERPVEFVLQDDKGKEIYQTSFTSTVTAPGVVGFQLPPEAPRLEVGKIYRWFFSIYCNPEQPIHVDGWVQRVAANPLINSQLEQATPQQLVALYTQGGVWFDAVTTLAGRRLQNPDDQTLRDEWDKLLGSVNLSAIASEPITSVLTPKNLTKLP
ncbi:MAG: DUF928 domain-containing protein [Potamolinea sp.]